MIRDNSDYEPDMEHKNDGAWLPFTPKNKVVTPLVSSIKDQE